MGIKEETAQDRSHHHHHLFLKRPFLPRSARVRTEVLGGILLGFPPVLAQMPDPLCVFGVTDVKCIWWWINNWFCLGISGSPILSTDDANEDNQSIVEVLSALHVAGGAENQIHPAIASCQDLSQVVELTLVLGGMDTEGEIFDDCLVKLLPTKLWQVIHWSHDSMSKGSFCAC